LSFYTWLNPIAASLECTGKRGIRDCNLAVRTLRTSPIQPGIRAGPVIVRVLARAENPRKDFAQFTAACLRAQCLQKGNAHADTV